VIESTPLVLIERRGNTIKGTARRHPGVPQGKGETTQYKKSVADNHVGELFRESAQLGKRGINYLNGGEGELFPSKNIREGKRRRDGNSQKCERKRKGVLEAIYRWRSLD